MQQRINRSNGIPLYLQLIDIISNDIDRQIFKVGDQLPSERELCELYQLSRITVRQALQELERDGLIEKKHGKGTFIADKTLQQNLVNLYSFTEEMKKLGKVPRTEVIDFERIKLSSRICSTMNLKPESEATKIIRLRFADNKPLMYETTYLPQSCFPGLTRENFEKQSMYEIFRHDFHKQVSRAVEKFTATTLYSNEAKFLNETRDDLAILIKRFGYDNDDQMIEYTLSIVSSRNFYYRVEISK